MSVSFSNFKGARLLSTDILSSSIISISQSSSLSLNSHNKVNLEIGSLAIFKILFKPGYSIIISSIMEAK